MSNIYEDRIEPPQSRIEERLRRIEDLIAQGGGGGDAETATDEDIQDIKDHTWGDNTENNGQGSVSGGGDDDVGQGGGEDSELDDEDNTATQDDINGITDGIWPDNP